jgi:uncharacterized protein YyaL (SSP411 family)
MTAPTNRLASETSPYLLQHAHNPVDWYPWGPEALDRARSEQRPIFLSIGYSACHWCHVMERESFENERIAALMNEHYVNVKVDREERPDIDEIYMKAVMAMTGSGGWPMSVFLTPDLEPFFGGTYFPPDGRYGRPGFPDVLTGLARAWEQDRAKVVEQGRRMAESIAREGRMKVDAELDPDVLDRSLAALQQSYEPEWGGFGSAPKFPHAMDQRLCLRHWRRTRSPVALEMAVHSLRCMANGGIYDQLGGGFHRYSTDEKWLIPHFEKRLYDNALLVPAYVEAWLATGEPLFERVVRECCDWMLREMSTPDGGLASTQDADSEGVEGKFFAWTPAELEGVLGRERGRRAAAWWSVTPEGNFEHGTSALWRERPAEDVARELRVDLQELERDMQAARRELLAARAERVPPGTDDKVLAAWNGLAISALAQAWQAFGDDRWLDAARSAARFVLERMRQDDGRLFATARHGRAHLNGCLDDYAFTIQGLIDLYESDFDEDWLREALALEAVVAERFEDPENGAFFTTGRDHEQLIARLKNPHDGALPSGNGVHAGSLLRLAELTGRGALAQRAERTITALGRMVNQYPQAFSQLLMAVDFLQAGPREIVVAGRPGADDALALLAGIRTTFLPQRVVSFAHAGADEGLVPLLEGKTPGPHGARAFVCRNWACGEPATTPDELARQLEETA